MHTRLDNDYKVAEVFSPVGLLRRVMTKYLAASVDRCTAAPQAVPQAVPQAALALGQGSSGTALDLLS